MVDSPAQEVTSRRECHKEPRGGVGGLYVSVQLLTAADGPLQTGLPPLWPRRSSHAFPSLKTGFFYDGLGIPQTDTGVSSNPYDVR